MEDRVIKTIDGVKWREDNYFSSRRYVGNKKLKGKMSLQITAEEESYDMGRHAYLTGNVAAHDDKPSDDRPFIRAKNPFQHCQGDSPYAYFYQSEFPYTAEGPTVSKEDIRKYHLPLLRDLGGSACHIFSVRAEVSLLDTVLGSDSVHGLVAYRKNVIGAIHSAAVDVATTALREAQERKETMKSVLCECP